MRTGGLTPDLSVKELHMVITKRSSTSTNFT